MTLNQCTIAGNSAGSAGGGCTFSSQTTLNQCTVYGNSGGAGGGIFTGSTLTLVNTIVANNTDSNGFPDIAPDLPLGSITLTGANWIGNLTGTGLTASATLLTGDPLLAPLGNYGGLTHTLTPVVGSPVINQSVGSTFTTDQRGLAITDGMPDLGATEMIITTVTTFADAGPGSLRDALTSSTSSHIIHFDAALDAQTIPLLSEIDINGSAFVDASSLPHGITVQGGGTDGAYCLLKMDGGTVGITGMTFTDGGGSNFSDNGAGIQSLSGLLYLSKCTFTGNTGLDSYGGSVFSGGTVLADRCTFSNNSAWEGAGIYTSGIAEIHLCSFLNNSNVGGGGTVTNSDRFINNPTATINQCTFSGNTATDAAGALYSEDAMTTVTLCTFFNNSTPGEGGAIFSIGTAPTLNQCTLVGNSSGADGGGISADAVTLNNCIVANNTDVSGFPDVGNSAVTLTSANWIGNLSGTGQTASATLLTGDPKLSPLGNYGGLTQTMPPLAGSPVIDKSVNPTFTTDQRSCPQVGPGIDLGAAECPIFNANPGLNGLVTSSFTPFSWSGLPGGATYQVYLGTSADSLSLFPIGHSTDTFAAISAQTLAAGNTYYWRVDGTYSGVTFPGPLLSFTVEDPSATTAAASTVLSSWSMLNGMANPGGQPSTAYFQYGTTSDYGSTTPVTNVGSGSTAVPVNYNLDGLAKGATYHYRLVIVSGGTTYNGADQTFTTPPATSTPNWHSAQITALTDPTLANMADGARTGAAHASWNLYFYKGTDNNIWAVFLVDNTWQQEKLTTDGNVADWLAYEPTYGTLDYQGTDGNLWCVYYDSKAAQWVTLQLGSPPQGVTVAGDIVVDSSGGWNNVDYRGSDSHLYAAYYNGSAWVHTAIGGTATVKGNLAVAGDNHLVYYQGTDNNLWCFYYNDSHVWQQLQLTTTGNVGGSVAVDNAEITVYYKSLTDNSAWCAYSTGGPWSAIPLDATANMSASATSFSNVAPYAGLDDALYLDNNGQCDSLFWNGSAWVHVLLGDAGSQLTGGLSFQTLNRWLFTRKSDGNVIVFYNK